MAFSYESRLTGEAITRLETLFTQAASPGWTGNLYERAKAQGLAGRKTVFLEDFRHFQAVYQARSPETRERAETWYQKVYKPLQEETKLSAKRLTEKLQSIRIGTLETVEQAEFARDYIGRYEEAFT